MKRILLACLCILSCSSEQKIVTKPYTFNNIDTLWIPILLEKSHQNIRYYSFQNDGIVVTSLSAGTNVLAGDIIAKQNAVEVENKLTSQELIYSEAKRKLLRIKALLSQNASAEIQKEEAELTIQLEQIKLNQIRQELEQRTIRAKQAGMIIETSIQDGEFSPKGKTVVAVGEGKQICKGKLDFPQTVNSEDSITVSFHDHKGVLKRGQAITSVNKEATEFHFMNRNVFSPNVALIPLTKNIAKVSFANNCIKNEFVRIELQSGEIMTGTVILCSKESFIITYLGSPIHNGIVKEIFY